MQRLVVGAEQIHAQILLLTAEQQHYLRRVLRLKVGDRFIAMDGWGKLWLATLTAKGEQATLHLPEDRSLLGSGLNLKGPEIVLAACLPKQGFDEVVRQATELGIAQIVPVISNRTLLRPSANKLSRWRRISAEAAEQSERHIVPDIHEPLTWFQWISREADSDRYLCVPRYTAPSLLSLCLSACSRQVVIAIGPEGGLTDAEVEQAISVGYRSVTLGERVLRAVTASVAAVSIMQAGFELASVAPYEKTQP